MPIRTRIAAAALVALALVGCSASSTTSEVTPSRSDAAMEATLESLLTSMADRWNAGDLPGHVAPYADSGTMMTGRGPAGGRERIAEMLARNFWRDGRPLQQLRFEQVLVRPIGDGGAVVTGRFVLSGGGRDEQSGWFTTVWEHTPAGWRIVHDHSG